MVAIDLLLVASLDKMTILLVLKIIQKLLPPVKFKV